MKKDPAVSKADIESANRKADVERRDYHQHARELRTLRERRAKRARVRPKPTRARPQPTPAQIVLMQPLPVYENTGKYKHKLLVGTPTLGNIRIEFHNAVNGLVMPVNFQISNQTPIGFLVADAQNLIAKDALARGFEWLLFLEDDVLVPPDLLLRLEPYMQAKTVPMVSGLYPLKSTIPMPFIFRGRGTGVFTDFKVGDKVWADGVPTGCLLLHTSLLEAFLKIVPTYTLTANGQPLHLPRIFETPRKAYSDAGTGSYQKLVGTSDLYFCDQLREHNILAKAGWKKAAAKPYPYLVDTNINCGHIERGEGVVMTYRIGPRGDQLQP
jgi:hypothetical protein